MPDTWDHPSVWGRSWRVWCAVKEWAEVSARFGRVTRPLSRSRNPNAAQTITAWPVLVSHTWLFRGIAGCGVQGFRVGYFEGLLSGGLTPRFLEKLHPPGLSCAWESLVRQSSFWAETHQSEITAHASRRSSASTVSTASVGARHWTVRYRFGTALCLNLRHTAFNRGGKVVYSVGTGSTCDPNAYNRRDRPSRLYCGERPYAQGTGLQFPSADCGSPPLCQRAID